MKRKSPHSWRLLNWLPSKASLDYLNTSLDAIKNCTLAVVGLSTFLFFLFPPFQAFVRDKIRQESAWFWVGTWDQSRLKFRADKNHYLKFYLAEGDFDEDTGLIRTGTVLLSVGETSLGRSGPGPKNVAKVVVFKGQCVQVLESSSREVAGHQGGIDKSVWIRALPNACGG